MNRIRRFGFFVTIRNSRQTPVPKEHVLAKQRRVQFCNYVVLFKISLCIGGGGSGLFTSSYKRTRGSKITLFARTKVPFVVLNTIASYINSKSCNTNRSLFCQGPKSVCQWTFLYFMMMMFHNIPIPAKVYHCIGSINPQRKYYKRAQWTMVLQYHWSALLKWFLIKYLSAW